MCVEFVLSFGIFKIGLCILCSIFMEVLGMFVIVIYLGCGDNWSILNLER